MFQVAKLMLQTCPITVLVFLKPHIERLGFKKKKMYDQVFSSM